MKPMIEGVAYEACRNPKRPQETALSYSLWSHPQRPTRDAVAEQAASPRRCTMVTVN